ncbi:hypothetical protein Daus18300_005707 [Diaporthe australafricana]|uniref:ubiquitinyl hydrolase 1 n=1 Tax=Diaporthe australafricana TaxID=127596 RepID=A0ABR3WZU4_9PEZI
MTLEGVFNHLVLPPKLPGGQDPHLDDEAQEFVVRLVTAIETLDKATDKLYTEPLSSLRRSLTLSGRLNRGSLDRDTLSAAFQDLGSDPLILYVVEQNAALIIRQSSSNETRTVVFEAFEASPSSEEVLASENALIQSFPGRACAVSATQFSHEDFQASLAEFLEKASMETLSRLAAHTRKAGVEVSEERDTTNPAMITQLLLPLLETIGEPIQVAKFQKRVRDEVNIEVESGTGSSLPFRRHPFWLILRVAIQRQLVLSLGYHSGRALYKAIFAIVLAQLMTSVAGELKPELTLMLRAKLCRRLAKLEQEKLQELGGSSVYDYFFSSMGPWLEKTIQSVTDKMELVWSHFKKRTMRHVEPLPAPQAVPYDHQRLQLRHSGSYLDGILLQPPVEKARAFDIDTIHIEDEGIKQVQRFTARYLKIVALEDEIRTHHLQDQPTLVKQFSRKTKVGFDAATSREFPEGEQNAQAEDRCVELAESIFKYFETVADAYESNPTQMSTFVLNLLHLWVSMDRAATEICPLLQEYHPIFTPELLDVLQLDNPEDFDRLATIQQHLMHRIKACQDESCDILSDENSPRCFAAKYVADCHEMQSLHLLILEGCEQSREEKEIEWEDLSNECEQYSQEIAALSCVCTGEPGNRTKDDIQNCTKCFYRRKRNRLRIQVHEDPLPVDNDKAAKIVFELSIPRWYEAYRNATFKIIRDMAWPTRKVQDGPPLILRHFEQLREYQQTTSSAASVTLASAVKSFLQTHWRDVQVLRGSLRDVLRPHAPKFNLYDVENSVWIESIDRKALTFQHICGVAIPACLQEKVLAAVPHPPTVADGPSSYAVIANQRQCPQQVSIHEFSAYQRLLAGKSRRWITMLVEMGSSHLNFSSSETVQLLSQLALQAGPLGVGGIGALREAYSIFADVAFCRRLAEMIDQKLNSIKLNWREVNLMDLCIRLSQRLLAFAFSQEIRELAKRSIEFARNATLTWIARLREELHKTNDASIAEREADYAFKSALLCRRTFVSVSDHLTADQLKAYCEATIALQENMTGGFDNDPVLKAMVTQDTKMDIRPFIHSSLFAHPQVLGSAIAKSWSATGATTDTVFSPWAVMEGDEPWVVSRMSTTCPAANDQSFTFRQTVHFNYVSGFLLVDGKPAGRLPEHIRDSHEIKELFGEHTHLRTYPSVQDGMSHRLVGLFEGWQIHFGLRSEKVIVRAISNRAILEFIPRHVFFNGEDCDLPMELIENCVHFVNLSARTLHVQPRSAIWKLVERNWVIYLNSRHCTRMKRKIRLICPYSETSQMVTRLFSHFESPKNLTTFLKIGSKGSVRLCVDVSRFELSFHVNKSNRLEEIKLGKEFDPNQDAGTLYGLLSKLVLRDIADPRRRTVIVPLGRCEYRVDHPHVLVNIVPMGFNAYAKYEIDDILGRLTCPPEPALLYTKAHLHALTSFPIPDQLTGRTGTEEAIHVLQSGMAQPWTPLGRAPMTELENIATLSPRREFYPQDKRSLQKTQWHFNLSVSIQHERLETLARDILRKSNRLRPFSENTSDLEEVEVASHLRQRAEIRRCIHDPSSIHPIVVKPCVKQLYNRKPANEQSQLPQLAPVPSTRDRVYVARDQSVDSKLAMNVKHIVQAVFSGPLQLSKGTNLRCMLLGQQVIGGFRSGVAPAEGLGKLIEETVVGQFGKLVDFSRFSRPDQFYSLAFRLALLSFKPQTDLGLLEVLVAIARLDSLKVMVPPQHPVFVDFDLIPPTLELLETLIRPIWPEFVEPLTKRKFGINSCHQHLIRCEEEGRRLAKWFLKQWPSKSLSLEGFQPETKLLDETEAVHSILEVWQRKLHNLELGHYIDEIQQILYKIANEGNLNGLVLESRPLPLADTLPNHVTRTKPVIPSLPLELLKKDFGIFDRTKLIESPSIQLVQTEITRKKEETYQKSDSDELQRILTSFLNSRDQLRKQYGESLLHSLRAMKQSHALSRSQSRCLQKRNDSESPVIPFIVRARSAIEEHYQSITAALEEGDGRSLWLRMANLWPGGKMTLLEQLRSNSEAKFGPRVKEALASFGVKHAELQWLERVQHSLLVGDSARLQETLNNTGHQNWNPLHRPDWLLMELEADLFIRPEQVEVANAIISPTTGANSVLQMNMGQGKTSCIVPMAMSILADTTQIARLVVPKALLLQTAQVVQSRIGGLVGREVRHIPFSRRTPTTDVVLRLYRDLHKEVRESSGILLTTSDHMLSFKLSGLQRLLDSKPVEAEAMIRFQETLTRCSRDVIDESDFTLGVKTQLIYPSGPQLSVDGAPYRWLIIQELLHLFEEHLPAIRKACPLSVEVVPRSQHQTFPMAFLLRTDAEDELHRLIIDDIANNRTSFLRLSESGAPPENIRRAIRQFLSETSAKAMDKDGLKDLVSLFADPDSAVKVLLLVRGLILNRILLFCMKRRYNVQYGLHPARDPMAVPFEAKGVPHESSEFGHPDVAIILTTLSFYYTGLSLPQFRQSLSSVLKADDAASAYDRWTHGCETLPAGLRHWNVINSDDDGQVEELYSHLRLDRNVLNFYLNGWVFPMYAKQFGMKLSASAWDLPNFARPSRPTLPGARSTGFSGTNDNKALLPLTIRQDDLPGLVQTNAEVLSYLLQTRNRKYHLAAANGIRLTEEELLQKLVKENMMVLIDAGAYVLELDNEALVRKWLETSPPEKNAKAGVYLGADNRAWVIYRGKKNKNVPLVATPFADNLNNCLVFLDEAHCRGTDLKLPQNARGALTLALGQTKDQTLATTQSVAFFAGPEVHQSIIDVCKIRSPRDRSIDSADVVHWLLEQSCSANEQLANLHLAQGVDYCRRLNAQWSYEQFLTREEHRTMLLKVIQQQERQTLSQQYGRVSDTSTKGSPDEVSFQSLKGFMFKLSDQRKSMDNKLISSGVRSSALEEVEQEREVEFQVEEVRQVQKQKVFKPLIFTRLHPSFEKFIQHGRLVGGEGYVHAFSFLRNTSIGQKHMVQPTSSSFFVSTEFTRTVVLSKQGQNKHPDNFLRPVEWILWSVSTETALVIIPEEAELLIPIIRKAGPRCPVHLMTYAAPVTKSTLQNFNSLDFYNMPPLPDNYEFPKWFTVELGIFAGRLYITYEECALVAQYLRLSEVMEDQVDGPADETIARNPVSFMSEWLALHRQSDIEQTPMGYILRGRIEALHPDHAFFTMKTTEDAAMLGTVLSNCKLDKPDDDGNDNDHRAEMDHDEDGNEQGWDDDLGEDPGRESPGDG